VSTDPAANGIDEGFGIGASGQMTVPVYSIFEGREFPEIAPAER